MKRTLLFRVFVLILVLWVFWPVNKKVVKPNVISQQQTSDEVIGTPVKTKPTEETKKPLSGHEIGVKKVTPLQADKSFSYLQLYRDFRFLSTCYMGKTNFQSAKSIAEVKQTRLEQFEESGRQVNIQVSATHLNHYEAHIDRCMPLREKYQNINMADELLTAPTATIKEKQLKQLRNLIQPWDDAWQHLFNVAKGHDNPQSQVILDELKEMKTNWNQQYAHIEVQLIQEETQAYHRTMRALNDQLEQSVDKGSESKEQAWQQVQQLTTKIKSFMQLQDADLFYEASALLNDDRQLRFLNGSVHGRSFKREDLKKLNIQYQKVAEEVMGLTGIINRLNFLSIAPFANQLYLCTTGQDCAPGSALMNHYCLKPEYPTACDKDLMAFFAEDYLSPNQLEDVLNLYDQLVIIYAE